jgi:predicted nucleotidyltransferase
MVNPNALKVKQFLNTLATYQFIEQLKQLAFVKRIYLFGSRARGDASERSDIDLAIDCPQATGTDWLKVVDIIDNADTLLKIDCVRLDQTTQPLRNKLSQEGIVIYEYPNSTKTH